LQDALGCGNVDEFGSRAVIDFLHVIPEKKYGMPEKILKKSSREGIE